MPVVNVIKNLRDFIAKFKFQAAVRGKTLTYTPYPPNTLEVLIFHQLAVHPCIVHHNAGHALLEHFVELGYFLLASGEKT